MSTPHTLNGPETTARFIFAGNATFTARSTKTGTRYTFRVRRAEPKPGQSEADAPYFVSLLTGSDNTADFSYMGMMAPAAPGKAPMFRTTKASRFTTDSAPVKAFGWIHGHLLLNLVPPGVELFHEGRCGRCGRTLTVPESIESGLGPECASKL